MHFCSSSIYGRDGTEASAYVVLLPQHRSPFTFLFLPYTYISWLVPSQNHKNTRVRNVNILQPTACVRKAGVVPSRSRPVGNEYRTAIAVGFDFTCAQYRTRFMCAITSIDSDSNGATRSAIIFTWRERVKRGTYITQDQRPPRNEDFHRQKSGKNW